MAEAGDLPGASEARLLEEFFTKNPCLETPIRIF
jgi:hypothetical protein